MFTVNHVALDLSWKFTDSIVQIYLQLNYMHYI